MIYKVLIIFILINFFITDVKSNNIDIKYKIEDEIITNTDIINEINYLIALNNNLKSLSNENLYKIAVNSAIKEKIKYIELIKYFDLESNNKELDNLIIQNLNTNFNTNNINDLKIFLNKMNLEFDEVRNKIRVELLWNKLIYDRYINKVSIDKKKLSKKIEKNLLNKSFLEEYFLEEILFELEEKETLIDKYKEINSFINTNNFSNAANKYSISPSSKVGGKIGWVKKTQLSNIVLNKINKLDINQISDPMPTGNGFLIIKISKKKKIEKVVNFDKELKRSIEIETDRQLNQYSTNFFNKIKKNIFINEL